MLSSLAFEWKRAVRFDSGFAAKLDELVGSFQRAAAEQLVSANGLNPLEFSDSEALQAKEGKDHVETARYRSVAYELERLQKARWAVTLLDETEIENLSTPELLNLNNVGPLQVVRATLSVRSADYSFSISFRNTRFIASIVVKLTGSLQLVQQFRGLLSALLREFSQPWWLCRDPRFIGVLFGGPLVLANLNTIHGAARGDLEPIGWNGFYALLGALGVFGFIAMPMVKIGIQVFDWMFPLTDFVFGGGVQRSAIRQNVRRSLWAIPVMSVMIPYWVNQL